MVFTASEARRQHLKCKNHGQYHVTLNITSAIFSASGDCLSLLTDQANFVCNLLIWVTSLNACENSCPEGYPQLCAIRQLRIPKHHKIQYWRIICYI